ncbi:MAG: dihydroorotate dehydrogenase [Oscillospiraceae bacterium]|nr:dihydroorotate dehydrogenase [Oscillospiraceae bacterium]
MLRREEKRKPQVDLSVELAGVSLKNPVVVASGTFGFGREYSQFYDLGELGGICAKGLTLRPREGNPAPRIAETPMGILNSVGLQNPGVDAFISEELPFLRQFDTKIIANISGDSPEEYGVMCEKLSGAGVDLIEVNISCPNVKAGGMAYGTRPELAAEVTKVAKNRSSVPVMVKLSPNVTDITEIARAVAGAGADALSLINTLRGMRIDVDTRRPILKMNTGGLSGPAVLPVAVRMVWEVASAVDLPILGMGGVSKGEDAAQLMLAGASAVAVGTALFADPYAPLKVRDGLAETAAKQGLSAVRELTGGVRPW